jgi:four helix bundle protein
MTENKGYKKLKVWEKAHKFAIEIYRLSNNFPREELYGLTSQIRRSAFSISLNIVEGHASSSKKEFLNFLNISNRSLVETEYLLEVVKELNFINETEYQKLERMRSEIGIMLNAFTKSIRASKHQSIKVTEIQSSDTLTL